MSDPTTLRILGAARELFAARGFQRTSMADVAEAAKISRATLYGRFRDKAALFDGLARGLVTESLEASRLAWIDDRSFATNLEAALLAKDVPLHDLKHSPHGGEVLTANADSARQYGEILEAGFIDMVAERTQTEAAHGGARLDAFGDARSFAVFVAQTAAGLKDTLADPADYRAAVSRLVTVCAAALRAP